MEVTSSTETNWSSFGCCKAQPVPENFPIQNWEVWVLPVFSLEFVSTNVLNLFVALTIFIYIF